MVFEQLGKSNILSCYAYEKFCPAFIPTKKKLHNVVNKRNMACYVSRKKDTLKNKNFNKSSLKKSTRNHSTLIFYFES